MNTSRLDVYIQCCICLQVILYTWVSTLLLPALTVFQKSAWWVPYLFVSGYVNAYMACWYYLWYVSYIIHTVFIINILYFSFFYVLLYSLNWVNTSQKHRKNRRIKKFQLPTCSFEVLSVLQPTFCSETEKWKWKKLLASHR